MKPSRIEALSDGIFAIVMTLLVLELHVPHVAGALSTALLDLWPKVLVFVISFVILAIYWTGHHIQFTFVKAANFNYTWLNILFLLAICLVPFSSALLGEYPLKQTSQLVYGINLIFCGLLLYIAWRYAQKAGLVEPQRMTKELRRNSRHKMLLPPLLYVLAILVSFVDTRASLFFFAFGPVTYFIPVDSRLWNFLLNPFPAFSDD